jgi:hypothetical protein
MLYEIHCERERWTSKKDVLQHQLSALREQKTQIKAWADFDEEKLAALRTLKSKRASASQRGAAPFLINVYTE